MFLQEDKTGLAAQVAARNAQKAAEERQRAMTDAAKVVQENAPTQPQAANNPPTQAGTPNSFSIADIFARNEKRRQEMANQQEAIRKKIEQSKEEGANLRRIILESTKPQRDEAQEKKDRQSAKIMAIGNMLSALAGGIIGGTSSGYVPKTDSSGTSKFIESLRQRELDYTEKEKAYNSNKLKSQYAEHQAEYNRILDQYNAANKELGDLDKRDYDLTKSEIDRVQSLKDKQVMLEEAYKVWEKKNKTTYGQQVNLENQRSANNIKAADARSNKVDDKYSFIDGHNNEVVLSNAEKNDLYNWGVENNIIQKEGSDIITAPTMIDGMISTHRPYRFKDQSPEHQMQLLRQAYESKQTTKPGYNVKNVKSTLTKGEVWGGIPGLK